VPQANERDRVYEGSAEIDARGGFFDWQAGPGSIAEAMAKKLPVLN